MPDDDWKDLADTFDSMAKEEVKFVKQVAVEVFAQEITQPFVKGGNSPVDTGNWMANNIASSGKPTDATNKRTDETGAHTLNKIINLANRSAAYKPFYIQNNTSYNDEIEYKGWAMTSPYRPYRTAGFVLDNTMESL